MSDKSQKPNPKPVEVVGYILVLLGILVMFGIDHQVGFWIFFAGGILVVLTSRPDVKEEGDDTNPAHTSNSRDSGGTDRSSGGNTDKSSLAPKSLEPKIDRSSSDRSTGIGGSFTD